MSETGRRSLVRVVRFPFTPNSKRDFLYYESRRQLESCYDRLNYTILIR